MHNFKQIITTIGFLIVFAIVYAIMDYLLIPKGAMQGQFYRFNKAQGIDFLVIGDSMDNWSLNDDYISSNLNCNSYVVGVNGGYLCTSYLFLLDAIKRFKLKTVVIDWDIIQNFEEPFYNYKKEAEFYSEMFPKSFGNRPLQNALYPKMLNQTFTQTFFKFAIFRENLKLIKDVQKTKSVNFDIKSDRNHDEDGNLLKPIDVKRLGQDGEQMLVNSYSTNVKTSDIEYIQKIKKLCDDNNIALYFLMVPIPKCVMEKIPITYKMVEATVALFEKMNLPLINGFNQDRFPDSTNDLNFKDDLGHMIEPYRSKFTTYFCKEIKRL